MSEAAGEKSELVDNFDRKNNGIPGGTSHGYRGSQRTAGAADFEGYFGKMADNAVYIGTDATENWDLVDFKRFSKPYFDQGKAWDFQSLERNVYFSNSQEVAWFDELLDTHMGLTRGFGVLTKEEKGWKLKHYVLSVTVPNETLEQVKAVNREIDSSLIAQFRGGE